MNIVELLISVVFTVIIFIIRLLLYPIDIIIATLLPDISAAFSAIADLLSVIFQYMAFAISVSGIPAASVALIVTYYTFKLTLPINVWFVKLAVKWFKALKL